MSDSERQQLFPLRPMARRRFLQGSAVATGAVAAGITLPRRVGAQDPNPAASPFASPAVEGATPVAGAGLSESETAILQAAVERLIPTDENGPGALDAGVDVYITQSLAGGNAALVPFYQGGLAAFEAAAGDGGFAALAAEQQDAILTQAEAGELADLPEGFFALLLEHTRQGMFSDPIHGGNKDFVGWDLIGYPGVKLVWTAEDQAEGSTPTPEHKSVADFGGTAS
jgi:hypothetical protein